jgi:hypothetical protein
MSSIYNNELESKLKLDLQIIHKKNTNSSHKLGKFNLKL